MFWENDDIDGEFCDQCFEEVLSNSLEDPYAEIVREAQRLTVHND
jgi:hypothetical protein